MEQPPHHPYYQHHAPPPQAHPPYSGHHPVPHEARYRDKRVVSVIKTEICENYLEFYR